MIGYASDRVKTRGKISMVQRVSASLRKKSGVGHCCAASHPRFAIRYIIRVSRRFDRFLEYVLAPPSLALETLHRGFHVGERRRLDVLHVPDNRGGLRVDVQLRLAAGTDYGDQSRFVGHAFFRAHSRAPFIVASAARKRREAP